MSDNVRALSGIFREDYSKVPEKYNTNILKHLIWELKSKQKKHVYKMDFTYLWFGTNSVKIIFNKFRAALKTYKMKKELKWIMCTL